MILLDRPDNFAAHKGFFSEMQFEGVVAPKHRSLFLKQLITYLSAVARFSAASLMFRKPLIQFG